MANAEILKEEGFIRLENQQLKEELNRLKEKYQLHEYLLNKIPSLVWIIDKNCRFRFLSQSFISVYEQITGIRPRIGLLLDEIIRTENYALLWKERLRKAFSGEEQETQEIIDGVNTSRCFKLTITPVKPEDEVLGVLVYIQELTSQETDEKTNLESDLKKALKKARLSDKLKSSFLANMSHEIRTPMNAILGFTEILRQEKDLKDLEREEYFSIIEQKGNELLQIISDIIDLSKIEAKIVNLTQELFDLRLLLDSIHKSFKKELDLCGKAKRISLSLSVPDVARQEWIYSDHYRLTQILTNLLNNAKKFTEEGNIEFGYLKKEKYFEFFVKDTGIGIAPGEHKNIFKRFRQANDEYTRAFGGTGLGLNICKNLVNMLGGKIRVESEPGKGSVFYFTIPEEKKIPKDLPD